MHGLRFSRLLSSLLAATSLNALIPTEAAADVCSIDPTNLIGAPISAVTHIASILTAGIGFGTSRSDGWHTAAIVTSAFNYGQSAAMLALDSLIQPSCGGDLEAGPFEAPTLIVESVAVAGTTALLVGALVTGPEAEPVGPVAVPYVAPVQRGAVLGVVGTF
jgi:hypothetical protein